MGASTWSQFVVYNTDPAVALRACHEAAFSSKAHRLPFDDLHQTDAATLNQSAPDAFELRKMLNVAQSLTKAFSDMGADTSENEQNEADIEKMIQRMEKEGFADAAQSMANDSRQNPASIEDLRELAAEAGTHSIIDIDRITTKPEDGAASPLVEAQLLELFRTTQPTLHMVQTVQKTGAITELCQRWRSVFFAVYADDTPTHYLFAGISGD